jgi:hypothetical protein
LEKHRIYFNATGLKGREPRSRTHDLLLELQLENILSKNKLKYCLTTFEMRATKKECKEQATESPETEIQTF